MVRPLTAFAPGFRFDGGLATRSGRGEEVSPSDLVSVRIRRRSDSRIDARTVLVEGLDGRVLVLLLRHWSRQGSTHTERAAPQIRAEASEGGVVYFQCLDNSNPNVETGDQLRGSRRCVHSAVARPGLLRHLHQIFPQSRIPDWLSSCNSLTYVQFTDSIFWRRLGHKIAPGVRAARAAG